MIAIQHRNVTPMPATYHRFPASTGTGVADRHYNLVVASVTDSKAALRPILALHRHLPLIDYLGRRLASAPAAARSADQLDADARALSPVVGLSEEKVRPLLPADVRQPHPLLRPLVMRAALGERIQISVTNRLAERALSLALVDDEYGIQEQSDAAPIVNGETRTYVWRCLHAGVYPIYNRAGVSLAEQRCLLGVLMIEP